MSGHIWFTALLAVIWACYGYQGAAHQLDIHLLLSRDANELVEFISGRVRALDSGDDIDFKTKSTPHITLYLTEFEADKRDALLITLDTLIGTLPACPVHLLSPFNISGQYAMWEVETSKCLQFLSDSVVNATAQFAVKNQSVPSWVYSVPEPIRSEKIRFVREYGSPNVFSQFQPHVTLAFDDKAERLKNVSRVSISNVEKQSTNETNGLLQVFDHIHPISFAFLATEVAISTTGPHGTVNTNGTLGSYHLMPPPGVRNTVFSSHFLLQMSSGFL